MSCITNILNIKGNNEFLLQDRIVVEGGGIYKDHEYLITFVCIGSRCGYVSLKSDNEYCNNLHKINCHGDISFYDKDHPLKEILQTPCLDSWIGFDCFHAIDFPDEYHFKKYFKPDNKYYNHFLGIAGSNPLSYQKIRTYEFVEEECKSIIDQLIGII